MAGSSVLDLILRTRKQGTGAKEVQDELKGVKSVLGDLGLGVLSAGGAVLTLRAAFNETVGVAQEYDQVVSGVSRALKIHVEEASRVIQVSDDFGISQEALTTSLRFALKEGITPNIEGLALMSDQYLAITDTQERAAFGQKNLGKNWMEFTRLLEAGGGNIRAQAAGIESGLIVTDEAAAASERYRVALDGLTDALEAVKVKAGNELIPVVTGFITAEDEAGKLVSQNEAVLRARAITMGNAAKETGFLAAAMQPASLMTQIMNGELDDLGVTLDKTSGGYDAITAAMQAAGQAGLDAAGRFKTTTEQMIAGYLANQEYKVGVDDIQSAIAALQGKNVLINIMTVREEVTRQTWEWREQLTNPTGRGTQMASGGDLPLWGEQLVEVGELGYEYIHIRDGKATVIPHSASRWMKEAGILPGKGYGLESGGGSINTSGTNIAGVPWDQAARLLQKYSSQGGYQTSGGQILIPGMTTYGPPIGSSPSETGNPWAGGGSGGGGGSSGASSASIQSLVEEVSSQSASGAAAAASAAVGSQIPMIVQQQSKAQTQAILQGNDAVVRAINDLGDRIVIAVGDALQKASG